MLAKLKESPTSFAVIQFIGLIIGISFLHWFLVQFYAHHCAPWSLFGPFATMLSLGSPVCHFVNYLQFELAKNYITIWAAAGGVVICYLFTSKKDIK